jgi:hypothetical protein
LIISEQEVRSSQKLVFADLIKHIPITIEGALCCPACNSQIDNFYDPGFICRNCMQVYNYTCQEEEWMILTGWQKFQNWSEDKPDEQILTPVVTLPYIPEEDIEEYERGSKYIDDSTIFHWACPVCRNVSQSGCD